MDLRPRQRQSFSGFTHAEMYKNQLRELAQRSCFNLPSYTCIREGPNHAMRFKATVNFNDETFESPNYCSTLRQTEHSAAEVALSDLSTRGPINSLAARILAWPYSIPAGEWFPGKITSNATKNVLTNFKSKFNDAQREILAETCFSYYVYCHEIVVQPQVIHYFLLWMVDQSNPQEMWFLIVGKYLRYTLPEFTLLTGLRFQGMDNRQNLVTLPSWIKDTYFGNLTTITNDDVRDVFLGVTDALDHDIVRLGIIYLITSYFYSTSYKKAIDGFIFPLVEDFDEMELFP